MAGSPQRTLSEYGEKFEYAVVGMLLKAPAGSESSKWLSFYRECKKYNITTYFNSLKSKYVIDLSFQLFDEANKVAPSKPPTLAELDTSLTVEFPIESDLIKYKSFVQQCIVASSEFSLAYVAKHLTDWINRTGLANITNQLVKDFETAPLSASEKIEKMLNMVLKKTTDLKNISFMGDNRVDYLNYLGWSDDMTERTSDLITMGSIELDELLNPNARRPEWELPQFKGSLRGITRGSLMKGQMAIVIGPPNSGKTSFLTTVITSNIICDKKILWVSLEETKQALQAKLYSCVLGIPYPKILDGIKNGDKNIIAKMEKNSSYINSHLTHLHLVKSGGMFIEDVVAEILKANDELKAINNGNGYDLLCVDSLWRLRSREFSKGNKAVHEEQHYCYEQIQLITETEFFATIAPVQTNRSGAKMNKEGDGMLGMDNMGGSFRVAQDASIILTLNRSDSDKACGVIKIVVDKSRSNITGGVLVSSTDLSISRTHGFLLVGKKTNLNDHDSDKQQVISAMAKRKAENGNN